MFLGYRVPIWYNPMLKLSVPDEVRKPPNRLLLHTAIVGLPLGSICSIFPDWLNDWEACWVFGYMVAMD